MTYSKPRFYVKLIKIKEAKKYYAPAFYGK